MKKIQKLISTLSLRKTNSNFFACLIKRNKVIFSLSLYSFQLKGRKEEYRAFWFRICKFIELSIRKLNIYALNIIVHGRLLGVYKLIIFKRHIKARIKFFFLKTSVPHNGCKLKKRKRK